MMRCAVMHVLVFDCCVNLLDCANACAQLAVVGRARGHIAVNVDVCVLKWWPGCLHLRAYEFVCSCCSRMLCCCANGCMRVDMCALRVLCVVRV